MVRPKSFKELRGKLRYENEHSIDWRFFFTLILTILSISLGFYANGLVLLTANIPILLLSLSLIFNKIFQQRLVLDKSLAIKIQLTLNIFVIWLALLIWFYALNKGLLVESKLNWQILLAASIFSLLGNLFVDLKIQKQAFNLDLWKKNLAWIIALLVYLFVSRVVFLDIIIAFCLSFALIIYYINKINGLLDQALSTSNLVDEDIKFKESSVLSNIEKSQESNSEIIQIDSEIEKRLLNIPKVLTIHQGDKINFLSDEKDLIVLKLVVDNHSSQEEIFEVKTQAKKVLYQNELENNVVEIEYEAEYRGLLQA